MRFLKGVILASGAREITANAVRRAARCTRLPAMLSTTYEQAGRDDDQHAQYGDRQGDRHIDRGLRGQDLLDEHHDGDHEHPGDAHDPERYQHHHQSDTRADAVEPERESRPRALAAAPATMLLEPRELVDTCRDHQRAGDGSAVWTVPRVHQGADECPDGEV